MTGRFLSCIMQSSMPRKAPCLHWTDIVASSLYSHFVCKFWGAAQSNNKEYFYSSMYSSELILLALFSDVYSYAAWKTQDNLSVVSDTLSTFNVLDLFYCLCIELDNRWTQCFKGKYISHAYLHFTSTTRSNIRALSIKSGAVPRLFNWKQG